jgi:hydrogenase maturation protease
VVVVGIGNLLLKDEGIGVHVAQALERAPSPGDVELQVVDGGTSPNLLPFVEGIDKLIILDAAKGGGEPGAIYRFSPEVITMEDEDITSVHQIGLLETLRIMKSLGREPKKVVIVGIEPKEINYGLELSPELERKIPDITAMVLKEIAANP